jgi:predicted ATPase
MKYIEVNNFRIFDKDNHFDFSKINVLTGANSSGKSSLIKLILLMKDAFENGIPKNELNFNSKEHFLGTFNGVLNDIDEDLVVRFHIPLLEILTRHFDDEAIKFELENDFNNEDWVFELIYKRKDGLTSENACLNQFTIKNKKTNEFILQWNYVNEDDFTYIGNINGVIILKYFKLQNPSLSKSSIFNYKLSNQVGKELIKGFEEEAIIESLSKYTCLGTKLSNLVDSLDLDDNEIFYDISDHLKGIIAAKLANDIEILEGINRDYEDCFVDFILKLFENIFNGFKHSFPNLPVDYLPSVRGNIQRVYSNETQGTIFNELLFKYVNHEFDIENHNETILPFINKWLKEFEIGDEFKIRRVEGSVSVPYIIKNGKEILLADLGFGITQFLPLLLKISLMIDIRYYKPLLIIEEPESNLHPKLQSKLADLFIEISNLDIVLLIETHSEYLIRKLQVNVLKKNIDPKDISIYYFDNKDGVYSNYKIEIGENGMLKDQFGAGFFDESADLMLQLLYPSSLN